MITFERYHDFYKDTMALELFDKEYDELGWTGKEYVNDMLGGKYIEASLAMGEFGFEFKPYKKNTK
jgi:hypothetical protein